jgi:hypothetical protein
MVLNPYRLGFNYIDVEREINFLNKYYEIKQGQPMLNDLMCATRFTNLWNGKEWLFDK